MTAAARNLRPGGEGLSNLADGMRALLEARFKAMDRDGRREQALELLRRVLGEKRAAIVAAAVLPETAEETAKVSKAPDRPAGSGSNDGTGRTTPPQPDLFYRGAGGPAGGA